MSDDNPGRTVGDVCLKLIRRAANKPSAMSDEERIVHRVWSLPGGWVEWGFRSVRFRRLRRAGATPGHFFSTALRVYYGTRSRSFPKVRN